MLTQSLGCLKTHLGGMSVDVLGNGKGNGKGLLMWLPVPDLDGTIWTEASQHRSPVAPTTHTNPAPGALCPLYHARNRRCHQRAETFPVSITAM